MLDRPKLRVVAWVVAYAVAGLVAAPLPRIGGLAPWYPPLAAAVGILVAGGLRWWPLILLLEVLGGWIVAGPNPTGIAQFAIPTVVEAVLAAAVLRRLVLRFERGEDALLLAGISIAVAVTGATLAAALGAVIRTDAVDNVGLWAHWWMSDTTTLTTILPLVLLVVNRAHGTLNVPRRSVAATEIPVIFAVAVALVIGSAMIF